MIVITAIRSFIDGFLHGPVGRKPYLRAEKKQMNDLNEDQIDSMIDDTFPASDPPGTY
ncbi:hypothetical protein ABI_19630 [Asticcacaulis biprosthecium C19]|uniref:Uncharacterized protein n=1 Tax=Asticcacaulis biprosthecium C19 TaxID=715226 RepID=F4QLM5_9CAUL|nr:hypothetical protein [Asticcacaulis biprosthecium]EGF93523.1 hypothetical protein ABI_19630 [Asticcacaulis biprosthecium C19]